MTASAIATTHALIRTNPKGRAFLGSCMNCGAENLPMSAAAEDCPNPTGATQAENLLDALDAGDGVAHTYSADGTTGRFIRS